MARHSRAIHRAPRPNWVQLAVFLVAGAMAGIMFGLGVLLAIAVAYRTLTS